MLTLIVVVGSVMAYGAVAVLFLPMNRSNALSMVFMVVPMTVLMFVSLRFVLRKIQGRMDLLTDALGQMAGGNLSVRLDEANAGEYAAVYSDFNHMVEELQRTKDEMMQFTNDFAHEFKTPLTSVKGFADYLYETGGGIESKERMEYLKVIAEQSGRLSRMASNTLILSKAEACQIPVHQTWFNMGEQIRRCFITQSREMEQKHLTPDLPEDFDFSFYGNEEQLEQNRVAAPSARGATSRTALLSLKFLIMVSEWIRKLWHMSLTSIISMIRPAFRPAMVSGLRLCGGLRSCTAGASAPSRSPGMARCLRWSCRCGRGRCRGAGPGGRGSAARQWTCSFPSTRRNTKVEYIMLPLDFLHLAICVTYFTCRRKHLSFWNGISIYSRTFSECQNQRSLKKFPPDRISLPGRNLPRIAALRLRQTVIL